MDGQFLTIDVIEQADFEVINRFFDGDRHANTLSFEIDIDWRRVEEIYEVKLNYGPEFTHLRRFKCE